MNRRQFLAGILASLGLMLVPTLKVAKAKWTTEATPWLADPDVILRASIQLGKTESLGRYIAEMLDREEMEGSFVIGGLDVCGDRIEYELARWEGPSRESLGRLERQRDQRPERVTKLPER